VPKVFVFPDGIRLAQREELPGPAPSRAAAWARIQAANIETGFTIVKSTDPRFSFYAEVNVNAPMIWIVFRDLCKALLGSRASLLMSEIDDDPAPLGSAGTVQILTMLETHSYQLAHDGNIQFGLVREDTNALTEVFVTPTKHFQIWFDDEKRLRGVLKVHDVPEIEKLEFIDQYPRTTTPLSRDRVSFTDPSEFVEYVGKQIKLLS
jgi:hypothetical protein